MSNWKYKLRVGQDRRDYENRCITLQELGKCFAAKIRALPCYGKEESQFSSVDEIDDCAREFDHVSDVEDFDNILEALYDWGDTVLDDGWPRTKMCWIEPTAPSVPTSHASTTVKASNQ